MQFPSTQWTVLAEASLHGDAAAKQSLEEFCRAYRGPVAAMIRRRGVVETRVEDLTHDFFLQLMRSSALRRADRARGRFRSFITGALIRFLADDADRNRARKRGGDVAMLSADADDELIGATASAETDEHLLLDREWALHLVSRAFRTIREQWSSAEREVRFKVLRAFLPGAMELLSQQAAAARLGITHDALRTELHRLREAFRTAICNEVVRTLGSPEEVADEMRHLLRVLKAEPVRPENSLSQTATVS